MADKTARDIAVERQGQFELYLTGLAFTVLGLAIQTAKVGVFVAADASELLGWIALLLSGLSGLRRLEQTPEHYRLQDLRNDQRAKHLKASEILVTNPHATVEVLTEGPKSMKQYAEEAAAPIPKIEARMKAVDNRLVRLYNIQRATLVGGFVLLAVARATPAISHLLALFGFKLL